MTDNAVYTPNPTAIDVVVARDYLGNIFVRSGSRSDLMVDEEFIREESATVVGRGNLHNNNERYYAVQLSDGSRAYVLGPGS